MWTSVHIIYMNAWCLWWRREFVKSFGPGVTDGWELSCGCWELSPDPLRQQVFFAEPSL